jgi:hypothetical protein
MNLVSGARKDTQNPGEKIIEKYRVMVDSWKKRQKNKAPPLARKGEALAPIF